MTLELSIFIVVVFIVWIAYCLGYDRGYDAGYTKARKVAADTMQHQYKSFLKFLSDNNKTTLEKEHEQRI